MRYVVTLFTGFLLGGGTVFAGFQYHFVQSDDGWLVVRKQTPAFSDIYTDVRGWTYREWQDHRDLGRNLTAAGHGKVVGNTVADGLMQDILGSFRNESAPKRKTAPEMSVEPIQ
jgi:hypothetical protein